MRVGGILRWLLSRACINCDEKSKLEKRSKNERRNEEKRGGRRGREATSDPWWAAKSKSHFLDLDTRPRGRKSKLDADRHVAPVDLMMQQSPRDKGLLHHVGYWYYNNMLDHLYLSMIWKLKHHLSLSLSSHSHSHSLSLSCFCNVMGI